jgi:hypothetical protein
MTAAVAMIPYTNMAPYRQLGEPRRVPVRADGAQGEHCGPSVG